MKKRINQIFIVVAIFTLGGLATADVPLNNLEGVGGVAFNPLAYTAGRNQEQDTQAWLSNPQFGVWYVSLAAVDVDWTAIGVAETFGKRLELSYGREIIAPAGGNIHKNNFGAKVLLLPENAGGTDWLPAISVGTIWKQTEEVADGVDDSGLDVYLVATKMITQLPRPLLVSGGALSSSEQVKGVFGYNDDRDITGFGNIDVLPLDNVAVGVEYKQGEKFDDFENANYWEAHVAWFVNQSLTLMGAYVNTGDEDSESVIGCGDGYVLSVQYAF